MLTEAKINEVRELVALKFSNRFICARTGVSRTTVAEIRAGKHRERDRELYNERPRTPQEIERQAKVALVQSGRLSVKLL